MLTKSGTSQKKNQSFVKTVRMTLQEYKIKMICGEKEKSAFSGPSCDSKLMCKKTTAPDGKKQLIRDRGCSSPCVNHFSPTRKHTLVCSRWPVIASAAANGGLFTVLMLRLLYSWICFRPFLNFKNAEYGLSGELAKYGLPKNASCSVIGTAVYFLTLRTTFFWFVKILSLNV